MSKRFIDYYLEAVTKGNGSGGGGGTDTPEIIIPDNSLGAYIEGEGEPWGAQAVVDWFEGFNPSMPVHCTFQGAMPSVDDNVLIIGDVVSSVDFVTKVGRYAIWGVCGSFYDGVAITFSEAHGYSVVDEEMPMYSTTLTENETYYSESGSQKLDVDVQGGGGGGVNADADVIFIDYDGTIVNSYTKDEFLALSAMPENPTHAGLTAQGWNWSLSDAQAYVYKYGKLIVGQMYITDDGKTRVFVSLNAGTLNPYVGIGLNGTAEVDWGDGSAPDIITGTNKSTAVYVQHTYATAGDYIITIDVDGEAAILGATSQQRTLLLRNTTETPASANTNIDRTYAKCITGIFIGSNMIFGSAYALYQCYDLQFITIPRGVTSITNNCFTYDADLKALVLPDGLTRIVSYAMNNCSVLKYVSIPNGIGEIDQNMFYGCNRLRACTIPESVTNISSSTFTECFDLEYLIIPDTVSSIGSYAFKGCHALQHIDIPYGLSIINMYTFDSCYDLLEITIPNSVTDISNNAFSVCRSLKNITVPDSVTNIGSQAFHSSLLTEIHMLSHTPPTIASNSFTKLDNMVIYVPYSADHSILNAYQAATNWSAYASYMVEE